MQAPRNGDWKANRGKVPQKGKLEPLQIRRDAAGIDVGATEIYVAVPAENDNPVRSFETFTGDLNRMADWLVACGVRTVAMESRGAYWIPAFQILESRKLEVCLVNAQPVKNVPGRKTDVVDYRWLQQLHSMGLLHASFRPPDQVCAVRSLMRHRESLVQRSSEVVLHAQKSLDQMNGQNRLAILDAILAGERDPKALEKLRDRRVNAGRRLPGGASVHAAAELGRIPLCARSDCRLRRANRGAAGGISTASGSGNPPTPRKALRSGRQGEESERMREKYFRMLGVDLTQVDGIGGAHH